MLRGHATLSASVSSEQGEVAAGSVEILMSQSSTLSLPVGAIPSYNSLVEVTTMAGGFIAEGNLYRPIP